MTENSPNAVHGSKSLATVFKSDTTEATATDRYQNDISRCWVAINLLAIAGVSAAFRNSVPVVLLASWSSFTLLNTLLHLASRSGFIIGNAAARSKLFNSGIALVFGLSWGTGVAVLLPLSDPVQASILLAAAFGVAVAAVPVFAEFPTSYNFFTVTLGALAIAGTLADDRYVLAILWIVPAGITILIMASTYYRSLENLRSIVHHFLGVVEGGLQDTDPRSYADRDLAIVADMKIKAMSSALAVRDRNRRLLRALGDAVVSTDTEGRIDYTNPVAEVLLGWTHKDLEGRPIEKRMRLVVPPDKKNISREIFGQARLTRRTQSRCENAQLIRKDGVIYGIDYVVTPIKDECGKFSGSVFIMRDVTEKRQRAESIAWQATHDPLTGTINRNEFELRLKKLVRRAHDENANVHSLLFLDMDKFKFINDSYGHAAGDSALKAIAGILRTRIRGADTLARVGGDEFTALLYSCSIEKARLIGEGLRSAVDKHEFMWQSIRLPVSISIGIVEINKNCKSAAEIIRRADSACYTAKKFGRNRVHLFERNQGNANKQARVFDYVKDIQTAIHGNRLELFYQPICPTAGAQASRRCELSVGIRNGEGNFIPRGELSDLARRYQLTEEIDRWVVKAAIDALRLSHPTLSDMELVLVPLSQQTLSDDRLLDFIIQNVKQNKADSNRLGFIFDEPGLTGHLEYIRYFVTALKQYDCHFMVSDMGFGSESVNLVKSLQVDFLGIRGALVENMLYNSVDYEVVLGLTRIAHSLGMKTVAESTDSKSVRDALAKMGVDYAKGQISGGRRRVSIYSEAQWI